MKRDRRVPVLEQKQLFEDRQVLHSAHDANFQRAAALACGSLCAPHGILCKVNNASCILIKHLSGTGQCHRVPCALKQLRTKFFF